MTEKPVYYWAHIAQEVLLSLSDGPVPNYALVEMMLSTAYPPLDDDDKKTLHKKEAMMRLRETASMKGNNLCLEGTTMGTRLIPGYHARDIGQVHKRLEGLVAMYNFQEKTRDDKRKLYLRAFGSSRVARLDEILFGMSKPKSEDPPVGVAVINTKGVKQLELSTTTPYVDPEDPFGSLLKWVEENFKP